MSQAKTSPLFMVKDLDPDEKTKSTDDYRQSPPHRNLSLQQSCGTQAMVITNVLTESQQCLLAVDPVPMFRRFLWHRLQSLKNVYLWLTLYAFQNLFGVLRNALLSVLVSFCANSAEKQGQCTEWRKFTSGRVLIGKITSGSSQGCFSSYWNLRGNSDSQVRSEL